MNEERSPRAAKLRQIHALSKAASKAELSRFAGESLVTDERRVSDDSIDAWGLLWVDAEEVGQAKALASEQILVSELLRNATVNLGVDLDATDLLLRVSPEPMKLLTSRANEDASPEARL
jgi:hypothetical protein